MSKEHVAGAAAAPHAAPRHRPHKVPASRFFDEDDNLDELSNRVIDLISEGRLEEAEAACRELKAQYPDVIDWIDRTAMLHEARGETQQAIEYYERVLQYMDDHPDDFEERSREPIREAIKRLKQAGDTSS